MCGDMFCCFSSSFQSNHDKHHRLSKGYVKTDAAANEIARLPKVEMAIKAYGQRQHRIIVSINSKDEEDDKKSGLAKLDTFSDYINRTKIKIRASNSNAGMGNVAYGDYKEKEDNGQDVFSEFVDRAKHKIVKSSSIASSRNISSQS